MPTKFITEFEVRASGLFGSHDEYFLRAVKQVLSDTALTWFVQRQQEFPITTSNDFKRVFRERLKVLISEIEPTNSLDFLKRKFFQKLRKDIRSQMPIGLSSSLSVLVQKAIEIDTNIIQQKIDDKLRIAQKEENPNKRISSSVNPLRTGGLFLDHLFFSEEKSVYFALNY